MSREQPTPEELDAIEQHQYGAYDVNLPDWYTTPADAREALEERYNKGGYIQRPVMRTKGLNADPESISWNFGKILDDKLAELEHERGVRSNFQNPSDVK